jgi:hypothetical protein
MRLVAVIKLDGIRNRFFYKRVEKDLSCDRVGIRNPFVINNHKVAATNPISLSRFGPVIPLEEGLYQEDLFYNLAAAIVYVYEKVPGTNPTTRFAVSVLGRHKYSSQRTVEKTHKDLLDLWQVWHKKPFVYSEVKKILAERKKTVEEPETGPTET